MCHPQASLLFAWGCEDGKTVGRGPVTADRAASRDAETRGRGLSRRSLPLAKPEEKRLRDGKRRTAESGDRSQETEERQRQGPRLNGCHPQASLLFAWGCEDGKTEDRCPRTSGQPRRGDAGTRLVTAKPAVGEAGRETAKRRKKRTAKTTAMAKTSKTTSTGICLAATRRERVGPTRRGMTAEARTIGQAGKNVDRKPLCH